MKDFIAGKYKKNFYKKEYEYKSFSPNLINRQFIWDNKIYDLVIKSERQLARLNAYSTLIPDIDFFILMHVMKEAETSSRIEGTQTEMKEVLLPKTEIKPEKRNDWIEVQNYISAINSAVEELKNLPLCMRLLDGTHKILLSGVRGSKRQPGKIRDGPNWIGGSNLQNAFFIPPHHLEVPDLLSDIQGFWHNKKIDLPELLRIAITHYQFETIHPYFDGNGRIGRLLITLQLIDYKILDKPTLYISDFFEKNKGEYYDYLTIVRQTNNIERWVKFFLSGVITTAEKGTETFKKIIELRKIYDEKVRSFGSRAERGGKLLLLMFSGPIMSINTVAKELSISYNTAKRLMKLFLDSNMVKVLKGDFKNKYYSLWQYLELFR
jgi:Fic family protein